MVPEAKWVPNGNPRELLPQSSLPWKPEPLPPLEGSTDDPRMATTITRADPITRLWTASQALPAQRKNLSSLFSIKKVLLQSKCGVSA